jgi:hypothetical protein
MQKLKTTPPIESPAEHDPVERLIRVLRAEGFEPMQEDEDAQLSGERIYRRRERVLLAQGDTVFDFIAFPALTEKVLAKAVQSIGNLFRARTSRDKALSVLQATTVYVCIVAKNEVPHNESLAQYVTSMGGTVLIPVVLVPEINQVVYPMMEGKLGSVRPRIEYLQYLLGERKESVNIHASTIKTFWVSMAVVGLLALAAIASMIF